jgi:4-hydroxy-tetrahydrodipicolinate synthase
MKKSPRIEGIVPPVVTPLLAADRLDLPGLERLIEHMLAGGVHGLFILGTTGEGPSLPYALRREVISAVTKQVKERVPVIVAITDSAAEETVALAKFAADAGASAAALALPYYFPIRQTDVKAYFQAIVPRLPLPVLLYNMPSHVKLHIDLDTLAAFLTAPNVIGLKDSSGDLGYFHRALALAVSRPDWSFMMGSEILLADGIFAGGDGCIAGGANVHPRLFVRQYEAAKARDFKTVQLLQKEIIELNEKLYAEEPGSPGCIKGIKFALNELGICSDVLAEPLHPCGEPARKIIREFLKKIDPQRA